MSKRAIDISNYTNEEVEALVNDDPTRLGNHSPGSVLSSGRHFRLDLDLLFPGEADIGTITPICGIVLQAYTLAFAKLVVEEPEGVELPNGMGIVRILREDLNEKEHACKPRMQRPRRGRPKVDRTNPHTAGNIMKFKWVHSNVPRDTTQPMVPRSDLKMWRYNPGKLLTNTLYLSALSGDYEKYIKT